MASHARRRTPATVCPARCRTRRACPADGRPGRLSPDRTTGRHAVPFAAGTSRHLPGHHVVPGPGTVRGGRPARAVAGLDAGPRGVAHLVRRQPSGPLAARTRAPAPAVGGGRSARAGACGPGALAGGLPPRRTTPPAEWRAGALVARHRACPGGRLVPDPDLPPRHPRWLERGQFLHHPARKPRPDARRRVSFQPVSTLDFVDYVARERQWRAQAELGRSGRRPAPNWNRPCWPRPNATQAAACAASR